MNVPTTMYCTKSISKRTHYQDRSTESCCSPNKIIKAEKLTIHNSLFYVATSKLSIMLKTNAIQYSQNQQDETRWYFQNVVQEWAFSFSLFYYSYMIDKIPSFAPNSVCKIMRHNNSRWKLRTENSFKVYIELFHSIISEHHCSYVSQIPLCSQHNMPWLRLKQIDDNLT